MTVEFEGDSSITTFDELTKLFEWTEPKKRNEKTFFSSLRDFEALYSEPMNILSKDYGEKTADFKYIYVIPYKTKQSIHSWSTLRESSKDAFSINEAKLFTRLNKPYQVVVKVTGPTGTTTKRVELDVFQRWDTLYNRDLSKYVK